jgi:hypothetical protein
LDERSVTTQNTAKPNSANGRKIPIIFAILLILFGSYGIYKNYNDNNQGQQTPSREKMIILENGGIKIPAIQLPETSSSYAMDMLGLIVYNGKIYTQTATSIQSDRAKELLGEKLGRTKATINEWSKQDAYSVEFASTIGEADVFSVKGYDKNFRIMVYTERDGEVFASFYECLNGVTVQTGQDLFGKLNMIGNISGAMFQNYSEWNNGDETYHSINDMSVVNTFVQELDYAVPYTRESVEAELGDFRNDEHYKELTLQLQDGSNVSLVIIKDGYIRYGFSDVYFNMDHKVFMEMWNLIQAD